MNFDWDDKIGTGHFLSLKLGAVSGKSFLFFRTPIAAADETAVYIERLAGDIVRRG